MNQQAASKIAVTMPTTKSIARGRTSVRLGSNVSHLKINVWSEHTADQIEAKPESPYHDCGFSHNSKGAGEVNSALRLITFLAEERDQQEDEPKIRNFRASKVEI